MTNRIKLLVVDCEVRFLNSVTQRLSLRDFDVTPAGSGLEALTLTQSQEFDVVLLDLKMPGMRGEELLEALAGRHPQTEMVIFTGHGGAESAVDFPHTGSHTYLQKTSETAELLRALRDAYQKRVLRRLGISQERLHELAQISPSESPLSVIRKLRELDAPR